MGQFAREPWLAVARGHQLVFCHTGSPPYPRQLKPRHGPRGGVLFCGSGQADKEGPWIEGRGPIKEL